MSFLYRDISSLSTDPPCFSFTQRCICLWFYSCLVSSALEERLKQRQEVCVNAVNVEIMFSGVKIVLSLCKKNGLSSEKSTF